MSPRLRDFRANKSKVWRIEWEVFDVIIVLSSISTIFRENFLTTSTTHQKSTWHRRENWWWRSVLATLCKVLTKQQNRERKFHKIMNRERDNSPRYLAYCLFHLIHSVNDTRNADKNFHFLYQCEVWSLWALLSRMFRFSLLFFFHPFLSSPALFTNNESIKPARRQSHSVNLILFLFYYNKIAILNLNDMKI